MTIAASPRVVGVDVAGVPLLLASLSFFSRSVIAWLTAEKFCEESKPLNQTSVGQPTLILVPRRTLVLSRNSISFALIFFTTSMSAESATYRRLSALDWSAPREERDIAGRAAFPRNCGGVPGGVVDSAIVRYVNIYNTKRISGILTRE